MFFTDNNAKVQSDIEDFHCFFLRKCFCKIFNGFYCSSGVEQNGCYHSQEINFDFAVIVKFMSSLNDQSLGYVRRIENEMFDLIWPYPGRGQTRAWWSTFFISPLWIWGLKAGWKIKREQNRNGKIRCNIRRPVVTLLIEQSLFTVADPCQASVTQPRLNPMFEEIILTTDLGSD